METKLLKVHRRHACPVCSANPNAIALEDGVATCATPTAIKNLSAEDAEDLQGKAVFIDVREEHELASGKIPGSLHIPLGKLLGDEDSVGDSASGAPVVVYCQHGIRSFSAASHLVALGFTNVAHLAGGIVRWQGELV